MDHLLILDKTALKIGGEQQLKTVFQFGLKQRIKIGHLKKQYQMRNFIIDFIHMNHPFKPGKILTKIIIFGCQINCRQFLI